MGRTLETSQPLRLTNVHVKGDSSMFFSVDVSSKSIHKVGHIRIVVTMTCPSHTCSSDSIDAWLEIDTNYKGTRKIPIIMGDDGKSKFG